MENNKARINLKVLGIITFSAMIVIVAGAFIIDRIRNPRQNLEDEEILVENISENSRLAGLQELLDYGLTTTQYSAVIEQLETYFDKKYPEYIFINYVKESLAFEEQKESSEEITVDPEIEALLLANLANATGATEEVYVSDEEASGELRTDSGISNKILGFQMKSNEDTFFHVSIDMNSDAPIVNVEIIE